VERGDVLAEPELDEGVDAADGEDADEDGVEVVEDEEADDDGEVVDCCDWVEDVEELCAFVVSAASRDGVAAGAVDRFRSLSVCA
jgi:hypothetical protein